MPRSQEKAAECLSELSAQLSTGGELPVEEVLQWFGRWDWWGLRSARAARYLSETGIRTVPDVREAPRDGSIHLKRLDPSLRQVEFDAGRLVPDAPLPPTPAFHVTGPIAEAEADLDAAPILPADTPDQPYVAPPLELLGATGSLESVVTVTDVEPVTTSHGTPTLRALLERALPFWREDAVGLPVIVGESDDGTPHVVDLAAAPHLLVTGTTGSGKSIWLHSMVLGLLYAKHPADLKFVMVDPKKIELNGYAELLNHFSAMPKDADEPIITDFAEAAAVLRSCEREMEIRYDLLAEAGVRGIEEYNKKFAAGRLDDLGKAHKHLPYLVVIVDELADLMMTSAKEVEAPIARLAQMARAVGIHLVLATQRPSVDVITGLIKANFPSRMAYQTSSKIDSRTIIDGGGAQQLVGNGDLLYMNGSRLTRLQGPFVSVDEVEAVSGFIAGQEGAGPYLLPPMDAGGDAPKGSAGDASDDRDELFEDAAKVIVRSQQGSVSLLQRKLSVGYTRAARLVDQLEDAGIVGPFEGSKAREVLIPDEYQLDAYLGGSGDGAAEPADGPALEV